MEACATLFEVPPAPPELARKELRLMVTRFLQSRGWLVMHNVRNQTAYPGMAKLTAIRGGRVIWLDIKAHGAPPTPLELSFASLIMDHDGEHRVVRGLRDVIDL